MNTTTRAAWPIAILGLTLATAGFAQPPRQSGHTTIAGGDIYEACASLKAGQVWKYHFNASQALDFNIHFHHDERVEYPVRLVDVATHADRYTAGGADIYCLMWSNLSAEPVELSYSADAPD